MASFLAFFKSLPGVIQGLFQHDSTTRAASVELWVVVPAVLVLIQFAVSSMGPRFAIARQINPGIELLRILSYYSVSYTLGLMKPSVSGRRWRLAIKKLSKSDKKQAYDKKLCKFLDEYSRVLIAEVDHVGSTQLAAVRRGIRGESEMLMGKNTLIRRCIKVHAEETGNDKIKAIIPLLEGNVGLIFTKADLKEVREEVAKYKVGAPARVGLVAPIDVVVPPGNTGLDPSQTSFQVLNIPTKINKGCVEIVAPVDLIKKGDKVGSSEAALLSKLNIRPFSYGLVITNVYDDGSVFSPEVLDLTDEDLMEKFASGVSMVASLSLAVSYSRRLVSDGILDNTNDPNYDRVFRVTAVELSFLQDFSYSKHAVVFARGFPAHRMLLSSFMIAAALIFIVVCRELVEIWVYFMSQWTKLLVVCQYIRLKLNGSTGWVSRLHRRIVELMARIMFRIVHRGEWNQRIQQHNLLMSAPGNRRISLRLVKLRSEVKANIFESLKALITSTSPPGPEENDSSESSIQKRNNRALMSYLGDAFADSEGSLPVPAAIEGFHDKLDGDTHKILAWHVATSLCQIHLLAEAGREDDDLYTLPTPSLGDADDGLAALWPHFTTVATLSNYCVHLVTMALLPDNGLVASKVFDAVRQEARVALRGCHTSRETHERLKAEASAYDEMPDGATILQIGAKLGAELVSRYGLVNTRPAHDAPLGFAVARRLPWPKQRTQPTAA